MGSGRKPTPKQRECIRAAGLKPRDYLVLSEMGDRLALVYRGTGRTRVIVTEKRREENEKRNYDATGKS